MLVKNISSIEDNKTKLTVACYDASKYNAFKHGVLSKYTVMQWENREDYEALMTSLINEYDPSGITEEHLVEELAGIIWRKMRLRYAEMTSTQSSLSKNVGRDNFCGSNDSAKEALLAGSYEVEKFDIKEAVLANEEETQIELEQKKIRLDNLLKVEKTLLDSNGYDQALVLLDKRDHDDWQKCISQNDEYDLTAKELLYWVNERSKNCWKRIYELENRHKIKKQVLGKAFLSDTELAKYSRYENHLDRKFEKTLAMLLKLKDLKASQETLGS
jgi:hypothetical protein